MKKLKDLSDETPVNSIKVRIPARIFKIYTQGTGLKTRDVYIVSSWGTGIWVKTDLNSKRIYPLQINSSATLNWNIIK